MQILKTWFVRHDSPVFTKEWKKFTELFPEYEENYSRKLVFTLWGTRSRANQDKRTIAGESWLQSDCIGVDYKSPCETQCLVQKYYALNCLINNEKSGIK